MGNPVEVGLAVITASLGIFALSVAIIGWLFASLRLVERTLFLAPALLLIKPGSITDLAGIALLLALSVRPLLRARRARSAGAERWH
jgi:TRAP-type uncharacterized transport system fused permease subunit